MKTLKLILISSFCIPFFRIFGCTVNTPYLKEGEKILESLTESIDKKDRESISDLFWDDYKNTDFDSEIDMLFDYYAGTTVNYTVYDPENVFSTNRYPYADTSEYFCVCHIDGYIQTSECKYYYSSWFETENNKNSSNAISKFIDFEIISDEDYFINRTNDRYRGNRNVNHGLYVRQHQIYPSASDISQKILYDCLMDSAVSKETVLSEFAPAALAENNAIGKEYDSYIDYLAQIKAEIGDDWCIPSIDNILTEEKFNEDGSYESVYFVASYSMQTYSSTSSLSHELQALIRCCAYSTDADEIGCYSIFVKKDAENIMDYSDLLLKAGFRCEI